MARLPYLDSSDVPEAYRDSMNPKNPYLPDDPDADEDPSWADVRHTHRILANNPPLLAAYRRYAAELWTQTGLTERQRELVILGCGRGLDSAYEWHQHVLIAIDDVLTREEILAISCRRTDTFDAADAALVVYAIAFAEGDVENSTYETLAAHFDESTVLGTSLLLSYYVGIDFMGRALQLDLEEEFVGWQLENV